MYRNEVLYKLSLSNTFWLVGLGGDRPQKPKRKCFLFLTGKAMKMRINDENEKIHENENNRWKIGKIDENEKNRWKWENPWKMRKMRKSMKNEKNPWKWE